VWKRYHGLKFVETFNGQNPQAGPAARITPAQCKLSSGPPGFGLSFRDPRFDKSPQYGDEWCHEKAATTGENDKTTYS